MESIQPEGFGPGADDMLASPRHGYRGEGGASRDDAGPRRCSVAISREAGARGSSIGRRAARKLGWQVYDQELLEHIAQDSTLRQELSERLSTAGQEWCRARLERLLRQQDVSQHPFVINLAEVMLALAAQGEVVLIGRGAGHLLPHPSTLHVRVVAPLADRVSYMSQWLRLTDEEAAARVQLRDTRRADFLTTHFHVQPGDRYQYDLLLNSSLLGEELCADLITHAARTKASLLQDAG